MNLKKLGLGDNKILDIISLSNLTNLEWLDLDDNEIIDISSLVNNYGLSKGDAIYLEDNPLNKTSINVYIPKLKQRGVKVKF
jgi:Leucine-rich repeat (LRR) protein